MLKNFEEFQKLGKDGVDATVQSITVASKGAQTIAVEFADYARKSFEQSAAATEKLLGARTLDRAIEVQSEYAKSAYEGFVAQATKVGEIYADIAKAAYKPLEGYAGKLTPTA
jgi:phasin family protein